MHPKIAGLIFALGVLLAVGLDIQSLMALSILILLLVGAFNAILRGQWFPHLGGALLGLLIGPGLVAVILRFVFAQLNISLQMNRFFGWRGLLILMVALCLGSVASYAIVKKRLRLFQPTLPPATNERQPMYAPRRHARREE